VRGKKNSARNFEEENRSRALLVWFQAAAVSAV
jgi:hypothetical protein